VHTIYDLGLRKLMQTQHQLPKNEKVIEKLQKLIQNKKS